VAHSYAGIPVIEGAAGLPNVQRVIYVAAFVPDVGESMYTMRGFPVPDSVEGLMIMPGISETWLKVGTMRLIQTRSSYDPPGGPSQASLAP
jgi:hypothetical protein